MKIRTFTNIIKQGFIGMWRNRTMSVASIGSVGATLTILGIILILILNINTATNIAKQQFDEVQVFLEKGLTPEEIEKVGQAINDCDGVSSVIFQSKEQALGIMKEEWGDKGYLLEGFEESPLPDTYIIQLEAIEYANPVVKQLNDLKINGLKGIEEIKYYKDIVEKIMSVANFIRIGGLVVIGILVFISVFIISNTVKITVAARKREIGIMKYVGATNGFIRGPFMVEGVLLGLVGTTISILITFYGYKYIVNALNERLYVLFTVYMIPPQVMINDIAIIFIAIGVGIGLLGSIISLKRFLNV
ncbi:permease-like cell division protein FtsX [Proteiniborus sp. MB09-C3]|uniref:permease-like cell division protein FtsX n=1 Tax=Proteiniborus sp. MB09-C3 TaxID=3050072 RepID=UPI002555E909|nr:permease-like cell division protein FtsX [Proteiniborus sp. MB09-C3]WIV13473.1 permease-like cell division protein FtsX [Proteiniborus sp. MB09-C3]